MSCVKCPSSSADVELPCRHLICKDCSVKMSTEAGRTYGLVCPKKKCKTPFSIAEEPHDGTKVAVKDDYTSDIKVLEDVKLTPCKGKIMGMTLMQCHLYVVCSDPKHVIFKYDISVGRQIDRQPVELSIAHMKWPRGIAASESHGCLYITDWDKIFGGKLWRYNCVREQRVEDPVAILDIQPFGVSVSRKSGEVLVTCATPVDALHKRGWIYVFEPKGDGLERTRVIDLPDLEIPRHSILTKSSLFLVCHGWTIFKQHGVTSFQDQPHGAATKKGYYGKPKRDGGDRFDMNRPLSMALDKDGLILVVDYRNNRIQLLTENLHLVRHLITADEHHVNGPRHVCVDPSTGRIYVGQRDGQIIGFSGR